MTNSSIAAALALVVAAWTGFAYAQRRPPTPPNFDAFYEPGPRLVTAHDVPVAAAASENGGPAEPSIDTLRSLPSVLGDGGVLNANFRLLTTLPPSSLSVDILDPNVEHNPYDW